MSSTPELITVGTYRFVAKAEVAQSLLRQEGIEAFISDANTVNADWFLGNAIGYAKLLVPSYQLEQANAILEQHPSLLDRYVEEDESAPETCLACGKELNPESSACPDCGWSYQEGAEEISKEDLEEE